MQTATRIPTFDLARAYAILGMYIVNFNIVFGNPQEKSGLSSFLKLFNGNSSTLFVILAGLGLSFLVFGAQKAAPRTHYRKLVLKRALVLMAMGAVLSLWWPADILHYYGLYMLLALVFIPWAARFYLWVAAGAIAVFHVVFAFYPYETGWDFNALHYTDLWTVEGFVRNLLYNGWNPVFPWLAFFALGMYLGRLNWDNPFTKTQVGIVGAVLFLSVEAIQLSASALELPAEVQEALRADYLPPLLPFLMSTTGFSLVLIWFFAMLPVRTYSFQLTKALIATGRMTLTHYISHLSLGLLWFSLLIEPYGVVANTTSTGIPSYVVLVFAVSYFAVSCLFSHFWAKRFQWGPFEYLLRKV